MSKTHACELYSFYKFYLTPENPYNKSKNNVKDFIPMNIIIHSSLVMTSGSTFEIIAEPENGVNMSEKSSFHLRLANI